MNEDKEIISQYKQLEELINTNKDSITKIEVDLKQVTDEIKSSSVLKVERRCKFWNAGYCKHKKACPFLHPDNIFIESKCADKICKKKGTLGPVEIGRKDCVGLVIFASFFMRKRKKWLV